MNIEFLGPVVGWPLMLLAAWGAGEWLFRRYAFPRVSAYGAVGLVLSGIGLSQGAAPQAALGFLANAALALTLFELGYRVNPRWLGHNPWLLATGIVQALLTFGMVMWTAGAFGIPMDQCLVLAALCVATSPAAVMRVTHELHSSGQVTERLLHLCVLNCLIAFLLLKLVVGYWHLETSGDLGKAAFNSIYVLALSLVVGAAFGFVSPWLNRLATSSQSTTVTLSLIHI